MMRSFTAALRLSTRALAAIALAALLIPAHLASAQGVTTGTVTGVVLDAQKRPVIGASVIAIHLPSGTTYEAVTRADGRFAIPGMRVGGPYSVVVAPGTGAAAVAFKEQTQENVLVNLGSATDLSFNVQPVVQEALTITAQSDTVFNSQRTGAATTVTRDQLATLPTIGGRLNDMTRLTPQSGGTLSFGGQDSRFNNIMVDGSYFNNSFGLRNSPGDTSGVAPISLSAIEQLQVSVAPYDVRQGNFVGAAVNTVTRSGSNSWHGSFYHTFRDDGGVGTEARGLTFDPGTFQFRNTGGYASGPIQRNKMFFFVNFEDESFLQPGTTFRANTGGETVAGSVTRVLASDLDTLSTFLQSTFGYETGPYQGYDHNTPARRFLLKGDYNMNDNNKLVVRYNHLDSETDILVSNSSSLGFGTRRSNLNGLNFQNSNYLQLENIRSIVGEWNSIIGTNMANNLIVGWTSQDESRGSRGTFFPMVDILEQTTVYTTFGFEPFTPSNQLRYKTLQVQNNFQEFAKNHTLTFGLAGERYESENVFFPGSQSAYVYNSLQDFYTDVAGYLADPNRTTSPVTLRRFDLRWSNIPGQVEPIQPLKVFYGSAYVQDDWRATGNLTMNIGLRLDIPFFSETGYTNANADALTFRDEDGNPAQYKTGQLPDANPLWSPRFGFNWDVKGNRDTQLRGGSGVFTGKPAYVWISNQVGNTGMLTGSERLDNTAARPFHPNPDHYKPASVTGDPATSYNLELVNPDFKFPQVWRTNLAIDQKLPWGLTGTLEYIYNRDVNGIYYINANLPEAQTAFTGTDTRPRWTSNRINTTAGNVVTSAVVLKNQNIGRSWNLAGTIEKRFRAGLWFKSAYSYGESRNTIDPGSIATGSFTSNQHFGDPNNPPLALSANSPGHRFFVVGSFSRDFFPFGTTTVSVFWESRTQGNTSYTFAADANNDGGSSNDLIYVPRDQSEMNFQQFSSGGVTYTPAMQAAAWDAYIAQDPYLSTRRGRYAERNAVFLPLVHRADFSVSQDVKFNLGGARHSIQFRLDIDNFTNLLNSNWGVGQRLVSNQPLTTPSVDSQGRLQYRLRVVNGQLMSTTFERTSFISDVYRMMLSIRYSF
jgi:hypothetical protein